MYNANLRLLPKKVKWVNKKMIYRSNTTRKQIIKECSKGQQIIYKCRVCTVFLKFALAKKFARKFSISVFIVFNWEFWDRCIDTLLNCLLHLFFNRPILFWLTHFGKSFLPSAWWEKSQRKGLNNWRCCLSDA